MENKQNRRVLIDPLLMILKSRRVLIAIASLIVGMIVMTIPQLEALHDELLILVISITLSLIGGLSVEDAVLASKQVPLESDIRKHVEAAVDAILEEMLYHTEKSVHIEATRPDYSPD